MSSQTPVLVWVNLCIDETYPNPFFYKRWTLHFLLQVQYFGTNSRISASVVAIVHIYFFPTKNILASCLAYQLVYETWMQANFKS